jgi:hypothetical protein
LVIYKKYLLLLRNKCLRLHCVGSTLLSDSVSSHTALSPAESNHTLNHTSRRSRCLAHKTPTLIQPRIRSALRAQSMSLKLCSTVDSSVDTVWHLRVVGLKTQSDTSAINACVDTFISRFFQQRTPHRPIHLVVSLNDIFCVAKLLRRVS